MRLATLATAALLLATSAPTTACEDGTSGALGAFYDRQHDRTMERLATDRARDEAIDRARATMELGLMRGTLEELANDSALRRRLGLLPRY